MKDPFWPVLIPTPALIAAMYFALLDGCVVVALAAFASALALACLAIWILVEQICAALRDRDEAERDPE